jgi:hypothetical protein
MNPSNYLQAAANRGQNFSNASGYRNVTGDGAPDKRSGWASATGQGMSTVGSQPTSAPYIITVTAASTITTATTITLFFANGVLNGGSGSFSGGVWTPQAGITVSTSFGNTTYQQLLVQSQLKPFVIGKTLLIGATGTNYITQVTTPINFVEIYADGSQANKPLIFIYDQYQQISTQTTNVMQYTIDGNAGLQFTQQPAGTNTTAVTQIYLYPLMSVDTTAALNGATVVNSYGAPAYSGR